jgi:hypothetical protein
MFWSWKCISDRLSGDMKRGYYEKNIFVKIAFWLKAIFLLLTANNLVSCRASMSFFLNSIQNNESFKMGPNLNISWYRAEHWKSITIDNLMSHWALKWKPTQQRFSPPFIQYTFCTNILKPLLLAAKHFLSNIQQK